MTPTIFPPSFIQSPFLRSKESHLLWRLPKFPYTEVFGNYDPFFPVLDQALYMDSEHGHVFLANQADPNFLYHRDNYAFETAETPKIRAELDLLFEFVRDSMAGVTSRSGNLSGLEFGANTTRFSRRLITLGLEMTAVDPLFQGAPQDPSGGVTVVPQMIEEFLDSQRKRYDLVLARHTLEHISDPARILLRLSESLSEDGLIVFEVPDFDAILSKGRFDAVFHQHLNYFDLHSITSLANTAGLEVVSSARNQWGSNGGSLMVSLRNFRLGAPKRPKPESPMRDPRRKIERSVRAISRFERMVGLMAQQIDDYSGDIAIFGAGLMLPSLDYHLGGKLRDRVSQVFDDDSRKAGLQYRNLPFSVSHPPDSLSDFLIVVGSLESSRAVVRRCYELGAGLVLAPLVT